MLPPRAASRRLFFWESHLRLHQQGFPNPSRWFCSPVPSAPKKPPSKKAEMAKGKKAEAVTSFVQRYMATNRGMFPKTKHVHDAIGGSWKALRVVLSEVKTKMFPEPQVDNQVESTDVATKEEGAVNALCLEEIAEKSEFYCINKESVFTTTLDLQESTNKLDTASATSVEKLDDADLSNCKHIEQSTLVFPSSTTDGQQLADLACHGAEQEETSALVQTSTEAGPCENVLFQEAPKFADSERDFLKPVKCLNLTQDLQTTEAGTSTLVGLFKNDTEKENHATNSEEKVVYMFDFYKNDTGKEKELNATRLGSLKQESSQDQEDNVHQITRLVKLFKKYPHNEKLNEKGIEQEACIRPGKDGENSQSRSGVRGFLGQIVEQDRGNNGSLANEWNKRNTKVPKDKIHEALLKLSMDGKSPVSNNAKKSKENAFQLKKDVKSVVEWNKRNTEVPKDKVQEALLKLSMDGKSPVSNNAKKSKENAFQLEKDVKSVVEWNKRNTEVPKDKVQEALLKLSMDGKSPVSNNAKKSKENAFQLEKDVKSVVEWNKRNTEVPKDKVHEALLKLSMDGKSPVSNNAKKSKENAFQLKKDVKSVVSKNLPDSKSVSEDSGSDLAAFDYEKLSTSEDPLFAQGQNVSAFPCGEPVSSKHQLLLKFVPKAAKVNDIYKVYGNCGTIADIQIISTKGENRFNYARVAFKTGNGLRTALNRTNVAICGMDVVVEPTSHEQLQNEMEKVKKIDYPADFLTNPSHAVLIERLPNNLSFSQLESALLCYGCLVGLAMGSSASGIYVEFEDEESKERALAGATISVHGEKLPVFRVEPPKTTVVRISRVNPSTGPARIRGICDSYGNVRKVLFRDANTFDVHFKLSEWPNMLNILNRLNGLVVDQNQWIAQPATVVPADVLHILWNKPEGRKKHVLELFQDLCSKLDKCSVDSSPRFGEIPSELLI